MPQTLLARKSGPQDNAIAKDDDHHSQMAADPNVSAFPQSNSFSAPSSFGSSPDNSFNTPSTNSFGGSQSYAPTQPNLGTVTQNFGQQPVQITHNQAESIKNTGGAMQEGADVLVANDNTDWINKKWRPAMGWIYMLTCTADFVIFPVLWSLLQALSKGQVTSQWQPLTLQGAGLYHIAMGAVLGIAAYGRTKEKIESKA